MRFNILIIFTQGKIKIKNMTKSSNKMSFIQLVI